MNERSKGINIRKKSFPVEFQVALSTRHVLYTAVPFLRAGRTRDTSAERNI